MKRIRLLDCSLRDGGHLNNGEFGELTIKGIIQSLIDAHIDIIEVGFFSNETLENGNIARFSSVSELKKILPEDSGVSKIALMADNADLSNIEDYDGTVEYIRLSFRKNETGWAEKSAKIAMKKGYKVFLNPIHCSSLSDEEFLSLIQFSNEIHPYGFSIVDTFGALRKEDLGRLYYLLERNLDKRVTIGLHLHENLGLSYSLAQYFTAIVAPTRDYIIDGSLFGIGKTPGNLCIEQIMDFLNDSYNLKYHTEPVYDAIDQYIMPLKQKYQWGYSIPYAISAQCKVHRTYAEYLTAKGRLKTKDIRRLLSRVEVDYADNFNESYIESLYQEYMNIEYDDLRDVEQLGINLRECENIVVLAPGASLKGFELDEKLKKNAMSISVNFVYDKMVCDFLFFTNVRRINLLNKRTSEKVIITSNLCGEIEQPSYVISHNELIYHGDEYCDDSSIMLLALLKRLGKKNIYFAGFDGFEKDKDNFYLPGYEHGVNESDMDYLKRKNIISSMYSDLNIVFLTKSLYS